MSALAPVNDGRAADCDAPDALTILERRNDIGAVFTDIEMPGMTGLALAGMVHDRWPRIAIIITSGRVRPGECEMPKGASYIGKPYVPDELVATLRELLSRPCRGG